MNVNFFISFPQGHIHSEKQLQQKIPAKTSGGEFFNEKPPLPQISGCQCQIEDREVCPDREVNPSRF